MKILRSKHESSSRLEQSCVISVGVGKNPYILSVRRLGESLEKQGFEGDFLYWDESLPEGCPTHFEVPFGFKTYCFYTARKLGYRYVLWLDSTCVAIRPVKPIFDSIKQRGYVFFDNNYGQQLGQWISDEALAQNKLDRDQAMTIPELPCSAMGLDLESDLGNRFLDQWHAIMSDGVTARGTRTKTKDWEDYQAIFWNQNNRVSRDPRVRGHRCDQPAAGLVAWRLGMNAYSDRLKDIHYTAAPVNRNTIILHHREFGDEITPLCVIYRRLLLYHPVAGPFLRLAQRIKRRTERTASWLQSA